jgi:hypothetical protein
MTASTEFGSGSSFSSPQPGAPSVPSSLVTRFRQHPIPRRFIRMLVEREAIVEACTVVFGYDLAAITADL